MADFKREACIKAWHSRPPKEWHLGFEHFENYFGIAWDAAVKHDAENLREAARDAAMRACGMEEDPYFDDDAAVKKEQLRGAVFREAAELLEKGDGLEQLNDTPDVIAIVRAVVAELPDATYSDRLREVMSRGEGKLNPSVARETLNQVIERVAREHVEGAGRERLLVAARAVLATEADGGEDALVSVRDMDALAAAVAEIGTE